MPFLDLVAIKAECTLQRVLDHIGWRQCSSKDGSQRGKCPLHASESGRSRIFVVTGEKWYCHKCKTGGDSLDLWKMYYHKETYDAALDMCEQLHVTPYQIQRFYWGKESGTEKRHGN